jgi:anti-sigma regulatory factor (Ser/Thr protein kinase)
VGAAIGLPESAIASLATAASELAHNHLVHAERGLLVVRTISHGAALGIEVVAADEGPGIADPARALSAGRSEKGGLGIGLAGVFRLADEVDIDTRLGEGTCIRARKFAAPPSERRRQVAIFGRPFAGEPVSGDDAAFERQGDGTLVLALADGLGHGVEARAASSRCIEAMRAAVDRPVDRILLSAHEAAAKTRGAVMTVISVSPAGAFETATVGNTTTQIVGRGAPHRFGGASWVLGQPTRTPSIPVARGAAPRTDLVVLFSDGLSSKLGLEPCDDLVLEEPIVAAQRFFERYGKAHDDALVLVAR